MSGPAARPVRIAVMGAGLIGRRHIQHVAAEPEAELAAVVDPTQAGREVAAGNGVPWYASFREMLAGDRPGDPAGCTPRRCHKGWQAAP